MKTWQVFMVLLTIGLAAWVVYLYLTGTLSFGPEGYEWNAYSSTKARKYECPPPECDCNALRQRIEFLYRKLQDTILALERAESLYESLYTKALKLAEELEKWKKRARYFEALVKDLQAQLIACRAELDALRKAYERLKAWCIERDIHVNACRSDLVDNQMLR